MAVDTSQPSGAGGNGSGTNGRQVHVATAAEQMISGDIEALAAVVEQLARRLRVRGFEVGRQQPRSPCTWDHAGGGEVTVAPRPVPATAGGPGLPGDRWCRDRGDADR